MISHWKSQMHTHRRVGAKVRELRLKYGLTQTYLAKCIGCHSSSISSLELGHAASMELLEGALWALGLDMTALRIEREHGMVSLERARRIREERRGPRPIFVVRRARHMAAG